MDLAILANLALFIGALGINLGIGSSSSSSNTGSATDEDPLYHSADYSNTIDGTATGDNLSATGINEAFFLYGGQDTLNASTGDDYANLGAGDDHANMLAGNDILLGGDGNDTASGGIGDDFLYGGNGNDDLFGNGGNDGLSGGEGDDSLDAGYGDDTVFGDAGNDSILGGSGNDGVSGGLGNDTLAGNHGDDTVYGDEGNDAISGGLGADSLLGGAGNDTISSYTSGASAEASMTAIDGVDSLFGGDGNDILIFGRGDVATGGAGADTFALDDRWADGHDVSIITDYVTGTDNIELHYTPHYDVNHIEIPPVVTTAAATIGSYTSVMVDGAEVGRIMGTYLVPPSEITLIRAS